MNGARERARVREKWSVRGQQFRKKVTWAKKTEKDITDE